MGLMDIIHIANFVRLSDAIQKAHEDIKLRVRALKNLVPILLSPHQNSIFHGRLSALSQPKQRLVAVVAIGFVYFFHPKIDRKNSVQYPINFFFLGLFEIKQIYYFTHSITPPKFANFFYLRLHGRVFNKASRVAPYSAGFGNGNAFEHAFH
jgi:hypothetical protein